MVLTAEQIDALSFEGRNEVWQREWAVEIERLETVVPLLTQFCREHGIRFELGPSNGVTVASTRPVSAGGSPAWLSLEWNEQEQALEESDA